MVTNGDKRCEEFAETYHLSAAWAIVRADDKLVARVNIIKAYHVTVILA